MSTLTAPLRESEVYNRIVEELRKENACVQVEGCAQAAKLHLAHALTREESLAAAARCRLIVTYSEQRAREIQEGFRFYDRNTVLFPAKDLIFYQADLRGRELDTERIRCLRRLMEGRPVTAVTTFSALMTPQVPLEVLRKSVIEVRKRGELSLSETAKRLVSIGYEKQYQVEKPGQFAIRGDILDIFELTEENPYRIELWGDEVDSIRSFDVLSQRSLLKLESVRIYPATEMILPGSRLRDGLERIRREEKKIEKLYRDENRTEEAHRLAAAVAQMEEEALEWHDYGPLESYIHYFYPMTETFLDLFPERSTMIFVDEPGRVLAHAGAVETEFRESMTSRAEKGYILPGQMSLLSVKEEVAARMSRFRCAGLAGLTYGIGHDEPFSSVTAADALGARSAMDAPGEGGRRETLLVPDLTVSISAREMSPFNKSFTALEKDLESYRKKGYRTILISPSRTRAKRLAKDLTDDGITAFYSENPERRLEAGEIMTYYGQITQGFEYPEVRFAVIAESDIFGAEKKKPAKKKKKYTGEQIRAFSELKVGDYVVHEDHGIGIYRGVEKIEVNHIAKDYIKIEYGGGGTLYVLPTELSVLQKYASAGAAKPKLNKLGTQEWAGTKKKVGKAVAEIAEDLVQLYAARREKKGYEYGPDTVWQREFEEMFPYEETEDQLAAIEETKRDMESDRIMDRLICGDVGYGKTEIAVRAAFKAVQEGKQVAVLVPTTILAQQHYNTFSERMRKFPVTIGLLSRFRSTAEQKTTVKELSQGLCDIVIGTHRLLSKDIKFKDLGLLVVDEEQRFGVTHKEKIKKMKENVDVLTLSATPIPRTLHMSLVGIRDMSVLEEAPEGRVPIQTYVMEYDEEMVREAILRELSRKGQVYYVHNRVNDIEDVTARLQKVVPEARIVFAHGQMKESELEKIMYDFIAGEVDVLVSTTIIETGLDISNVNTIIIHDSDRMGLSQLYQLRGRVGRSGRTAYAFLMYRRDRILREVAEKRLRAIREYTDLGSGFRIAMRDLEIRGAGSILGKSQHGHMQAVGYDLYCKLLNTAVRQAKGEAVEEERTVRVGLSADAFLPDSYIMNEEQKLEVYKKIAAIESTEDYDDIREELEDRFGEIPAPALNLLRIALIRSVAARVGISEIVGLPGTIRFYMDPDAKIRGENIPALLRSRGKDLTFSMKGFSRRGVPEFLYRYKAVGVTVRDEQILLNCVEELLVAMAHHLV